MALQQERKYSMGLKLGDWVGYFIALMLLA